MRVDREVRLRSDAFRMRPGGRGKSAASVKVGVEWA
jgi:hypothetical protein